MNSAIKTDRLILRPLQAGDDDLLWPATADPEISFYMAWQPHVAKAQTTEFVEQEVKRLEEDRGISWVIIREGELIGIVSLIGVTRKHRALRYDKAELAYWLITKYRRQGFMVEAVQHVLQYAFDILKLHKVVVSHFKENVRSQRLIERLGFRLIGEQVAEFQKANVWYNHVLYEMLETEYKQSNKVPTTAGYNDQALTNKQSELGCNVAAKANSLCVGRPNIGSRKMFLRRVNEIMDRRWLTNGGQCVQDLEHRLSIMLGVRHCITICNGTVALELAIRALGLTGEVIVPSFTFVATAHALQWQGITPVFCDVDPITHSLDPGRIERIITPRTTGIIGVHVWGRACDVDALSGIARRRGLKLLFDAAHAFNCTYKGRMIGNFGEAEVFSFHATKFFNTLEGGAIATNSDELARKIRLMKNFGFTNYDQVDYIGTNGKMNEISAAMGLTNLESLDEFMAVNRRNYDTYQRELVDVPGLTVFACDANEQCNYQYVVVEVDAEHAGLTRDELVTVLHAENVLARRYFYPGCHRMEPYRSFFPHAGLMLPETERLCQRTMCLPTGTAVDQAIVGKIANIIRLSVQRSEYVRKTLALRHS